MKKKKENKFVTPKPLLHLTTKFHIFLHTYWLLTKTHKVGCHIMFFIQIAINQLTELARETQQDLSSMVSIFVAFFKEHPKIVAFPAWVNTSSKSNCSQFDNDTFMLGIDSLYSCTMSGNKNRIEILRENLSLKNIGGIGESKLSIQGIEIFLFWIQDESNETCTIWIIKSHYVPDLLLPLVSQQHWG